MGTVYSENHHLYNMYFNAFRDSEYIIVLVGNHEMIQEVYDIPDNFIIKSFVSQAEVFKRASLFISNGGFNSISEAIYYKLPMIIIPQGADNLNNAYRIAELQIGILLK